MEPRYKEDIEDQYRKGFSEELEQVFSTVKMSMDSIQLFKIRADSITSDLTLQNASRTKDYLSVILVRLFLSLSERGLAEFHATFTSVRSLTKDLTLFSDVLEICRRVKAAQLLNSKDELYNICSLLVEKCRLEAFEIAQTTLDEPAVGFFLLGLVRCNALIGRFSYAFEIVQMMPLSDHGKAFSYISIIYADQGKFDEALETADKIDEKSIRENTLGYICLPLIRKGKVREALILSDKMPNTDQYAIVHMQISEALMENGFVRESVEYWEKYPKDNFCYQIFVKNYPNHFKPQPKQSKKWHREIYCARLAS
jgi:tetratricopeptide (TPR) repeat protein